MTDPVADPASPPAGVLPVSGSGDQNPLADLGNLRTARRLAALEAAFASLVEIQLVTTHDGLASARQWYEDYQAEHAPAADPPVGVQSAPVVSTP